MELNISQIDSVLSQILKGKEEVEYHFDIELLSNVVDSYNDFQRAGTTFDFAYEIIKYLRSESIANHIREAVFYN